MKNIFIGLLILTLSNISLAESNIEKSAFLVNKVKEISEIEKQINDLVKKSQTTEMNEKQQLENICKQRLLIEKKAIIFTELAYSETIKEDPVLKNRKNDYIRESEKLRETVLLLDQITIKDYKKPLYQVCKEI